MGDGTALFIGRLSKEARAADLEDVFYKYGKLVRCDVKYGSSMAYGFVEYEDPRDARDAMDKEHGREILGSKIVVEASRNGGERGRPRDDDRGYRGGDRDRGDDRRYGGDRSRGDDRRYGGDRDRGDDRRNGGRYGGGGGGGGGHGSRYGNGGGSSGGGGYGGGRDRDRGNDRFSDRGGYDRRRSPSPRFRSRRSPSPPRSGRRY